MRNYIISLGVSMLVCFLLLRMFNFFEAKIDEETGGPKTDTLVITTFFGVNILTIIALYSFLKILKLIIAP